MTTVKSFLIFISKFSTFKFPKKLKGESLKFFPLSSDSKKVTKILMLGENSVLWVQVLGLIAWKGDISSKLKIPKQSQIITEVCFKALCEPSSFMGYRHSYVVFLICLSLKTLFLTLRCISDISSEKYLYWPNSYWSQQKLPLMKSPQTKLTRVTNCDEKERRMVLLGNKVTPWDLERNFGSRPLVWSQPITFPVVQLPLLHRADSSLPSRKWSEIPGK